MSKLIYVLLAVCGMLQVGGATNTTAHTCDEAPWKEAKAAIVDCVKEKVIPLLPSGYSAVLCENFHLRGTREISFEFEMRNGKCYDPIKVKIPYGLVPILAGIFTGLCIALIFEIVKCIIKKCDKPKTLQDGEPLINNC